jgi:hypothetical protein
VTRLKLPIVSTSIPFFRGERLGFRIGVRDSIMASDL